MFSYKNIDQVNEIINLFFCRIGPDLHYHNSDCLTDIQIHSIPNTCIFLSVIILIYYTHTMQISPLSLIPQVQTGKFLSHIFIFPK